MPQLFAPVSRARREYLNLARVEADLMMDADRDVWDCAQEAMIECLLDYVRADLALSISYAANNGEEWAVRIREGR